MGNVFSHRALCYVSSSREMCFLIESYAKLSHVVVAILDFQLTQTNPSWLLNGLVIPDKNKFKNSFPQEPYVNCDL